VSPVSSLILPTSSYRHKLTCRALPWIRHPRPPHPLLALHWRHRQRCISHPLLKCPFFKHSFHRTPDVTRNARRVLRPRSRISFKCGCRLPLQSIGLYTLWITSPVAVLSRSE
jgi:hypothetical protein